MISGSDKVGARCIAIGACMHVHIPEFFAGAVTSIRLAFNFCAAINDGASRNSSKSLFGLYTSYIQYE